MCMFLSFYVQHVYSNLPCTTQGALPSQVPECSGIDYYSASCIWIHNDANSFDTHLYAIDSSGSLIRSVNITNAFNVDWEDLTHDAGYHFMYIGDFGNNLYNRTNLRIYRVPYNSLLTSTSVSASAINFSYPDQTQFPATWTNFDMEAFIHYRGKLYLFSKASGAAAGYTKLYSLPDTPGTYVATLIDSFYVQDRITGADINEDSSSVAIISNENIRIFRNWTGNNFFTGTYTMLSFAGGVTHKEGIAFMNDNHIYLVDEDHGTGNFLYTADLTQWIPTTTNILKAPDLPIQFSIYPNPAHNLTTVKYTTTLNQNITLEILNMSGEIIFSDDAGIKAGIDRTLDLNTIALPAGIYFVKLTCNGKISYERLVRF